MSKHFDDNELTRFAQRYMNQWNESDPRIHRKLIEETLAPTGGETLVDSPEEVRARDAPFKALFVPSKTPSRSTS